MSLRSEEKPDRYGLHLPPPQAIDLEETVLGMAMQSRVDGMMVIEKLIPEDFFLEQHRHIFEAMQELAKNGLQLDMRAVLSVLRKQNRDELAGGGVYLAELTSRVASAANVEYFCHVLKEQTIKRTLIQLGMKISGKGYLPETDAFELLNELRTDLIKMDQGVTGNRKEQHIKDGLYTLAMQMQERAKLEDKVVMTGVPSGMISIDRILQGFQPSDLIILAGRPGMAKSSLAVQIGRNAAVDFKIPTAIFSLEMSNPQLVNKLASIESEIDLKIIRGEKFNPIEWERFTQRTAGLSKAPLYLDDSASLNILDIRARCRRFKDEYNIGLIIIDYLQLVRGERSLRGNREEEISSITRTLKLIAKELNVPVIALSQLSREVEKRGGDKRPQLSDLRESGSIEQDADVVGFLWRPEYYKIEVDRDGNVYPPGFTEVIFAKHRNGAQGTARIQFIGKYTGFREIRSEIEPSPFSGMTAMTVIKREESAPTAFPDTSDDMPF